MSHVISQQEVVICTQKTMILSDFTARELTMSKLITSYRVKKNAAEALQEKAVEITIAKKELVTEANIIDWLLNNKIKEIDPEKWPDGK